jgi:hypothetical protein
MQSFIIQSSTEQALLNLFVVNIELGGWPSAWNELQL